MDRISVRALATAVRLIREPVVVTYSYPRSHPLYGAGEECGVYVPAALWDRIITGDYMVEVLHGIKIHDAPAAVSRKPRGMADGEEG